MSIRKTVGTTMALCSICLTAGCSPKMAKDPSPTTQTTKESTMSTHTQTPSGLQYEVTTPGTGECPATGKKVTVHYTGYLYNPTDDTVGAKFDSSLDRGQPFTFTIGIGQVISGWDEGVMDMKVGEKRVLIIPPALGYGARGAGNAIPPHATLKFEVELLSVQ